MKLTKEDIDKVRHIEGFPIAKDDNIISLSNPPYYTACPNPFIEQFILDCNSNKCNEEDYKRLPFSADIREGKNDPMYMAHSYHTKVPYKAIMRYILHYTNPGDIVLDGFSGSGMTGVAAQLCASPPSDFRSIIEQEMTNVNWGKRNVILNDLSPEATFIASNYNMSVDSSLFYDAAELILNNTRKELSWIYETKSENAGMFQGEIQYTVWSDIFICPNCSTEIIYWDINVENIKNDKKAYCHSCNSEITTTNSERSMELYFDDALNEEKMRVKQTPVMIKYSVGKKQYKKKPDTLDIERINRVDSMKIDTWFPVDRMCYGNEARRNDKYGLTHTHHFYTKRNLIVLSYVFSQINQVTNKRVRNHLMFWFSSIYSRSHKLNRYMPTHNRHVGPLAGTLYLPFYQAEINIINLLAGKLGAIQKVKIDSDSAILTNQSLTQMDNVPENSIDYIFTDPPFGANIDYSELNFIWESWLGVSTNNLSEAIVNKSQEKGLNDYQELITKCFSEYYRVLKPNRWITIEFSNSKNSVWIAIQEAINRAGFVIADIRVLDKVKGTTKQLSYASAVKQDLIISAYKPMGKFEEKILSHSGSQETVWDFVYEHLSKLQIYVQKDDQIETLREREAYMLYDRMLSYHIVHGLAVPIDVADFYKGLDERYLKRDNMYFLHDQINKYDEARDKFNVEDVQYTLYVYDEKTAISWLYFQLERPQKYSDLQPKFIKELRKLKHEKMPELLKILEENFLLDADDRWYIPDPSKEGDLIKLREKRLLKEFEGYFIGKGKLKLFRTESIKVGFASLWKDKNYQGIVNVGRRLPEKVIQEDDKLLMYYDMSLSRVE